jgi:uncharacterized protein YdeI (YjbR/CyaY-like superfamily)
MMVTGEQGTRNAGGKLENGKLDWGVVTPRFFRTQAAFRSWLAKNHAKPDGLLVGFHKLGSGKGGITYGQALDEALCFGWIDGVRRNLDESSWSIRFTPRRRGSVWSKVNIGHVERLQEAGLMREAGLAAYAKRSEQRSGIYAYESRPQKLDAASEKKLKQNKQAWAFWEKQPPGYRRLTSFWVMSAKREETRAKRLAALIERSGDGERLPQLTSPYKKKAGA